jgi:Reverse transcriptase (RNA-dependent DNA polymerase)
VKKANLLKPVLPLVGECALIIEISMQQQGRTTSLCLLCTNFSRDWSTTHIFVTWTGIHDFFQVSIHPQDQKNITFMCPYRTYAYRRMSFGLYNAPATFQRAMMVIFSDFIEKEMKVFMDDFSVYSTSFDSCLANLCKILQRNVEVHLVLN